MNKKRDKRKNFSGVRTDKGKSKKHLVRSKMRDKKNW